MPILHVVLIALIQGVTEFLPVSSSGHLVLFHGFAGSDVVGGSDQQMSLLIDIAVHVGTLLAVCLYFWRDIWLMMKGCMPLLMGRFNDQGAQLNIYILISSIPVIVAGFALHALDPYWLREIWVVATTTIIFGALLWYADEGAPLWNPMLAVSASSAASVRVVPPMSRLATRSDPASTDALS